MQQQPNPTGARSKKKKEKETNRMIGSSDYELYPQISYPQGAVGGAGIGGAGDIVDGRMQGGYDGLDPTLYIGNLPSFQESYLPVQDTVPAGYKTNQQGMSSYSHNLYGEQNYGGYPSPYETQYRDTALPSQYLSDSTYQTSTCISGVYYQDQYSYQDPPDKIKASPKKGTKKKPKMYDLPPQSDPELEEKRKIAIKSKKHREKEKAKEENMEKMLLTVLQEVENLKLEKQTKLEAISRLERRAFGGGAGGDYNTSDDPWGATGGN